MTVGLKVHTHIKLECLVVKMLDTSRGADHLDMLKCRARGREREGRVMTPMRDLRVDILGRRENNYWVVYILHAKVKTDSQVCLAGKLWHCH